MFGQLFRQADTDGLGVVTGEVAVKFFEKTRLEPRILGEVCAPSYQPQRSHSWDDGTRGDADIYSSRYGRLRIRRTGAY